MNPELCHQALSRAERQILGILYQNRTDRTLQQLIEQWWLKSKQQRLLEKQNYPAARPWLPPSAIRMLKANIAHA